MSASQKALEKLELSWAQKLVKKRRGEPRSQAWGLLINSQRLQLHHRTMQAALWEVRRVLLSVDNGCEPKTRLTFLPGWLRETKRVPWLPPTGDSAGIQQPAQSHLEHSRLKTKEPPAPSANLPQSSKQGKGQPWWEDGFVAEACLLNKPCFCPGGRVTWHELPWLLGAILNLGPQHDEDHQVAAPVKACSTEPGMKRASSQIGFL